MTSNQPTGRKPSGGVPPATARRSARQQRLASREANRALTRASTRGSSGSSFSLLLYSGAAIVIAVVVIALAVIVTNGSKSSGPLPGIQAPGQTLTPSGIPANGMTLGNPNAAHTIDLYEDYQCINCWRFTNESMPQIIEKYVIPGTVKIVYHDFLVIDSGTTNTESIDSANAARCANDQGKFWQYHDWLFGNQFGERVGSYTKDRLKEIAQKMGGLDLGKFNSCVDAGTYNAQIQSEQSKIPSGLKGTPTVVVDGKILASWDFASVSAALDTALGITPSPSPSASGAPSASPSVKPS